MRERIKELQTEIYQKQMELNKLRKEVEATPVKNYEFQTLNGNTSLLDLFAGKEFLYVIHNMGAGCRYCTLWADGFNAFLPHLEDKVSVVLASKDSPEKQRAMANDRGWRFRMVSHGGGEYLKEQSVGGAEGDKALNYPGIVVYQRKGNEILKKNWAVFGPGDEFCSQWNLLSLAGIGEGEWTPQFHYWKRPEKMEDGGQNLND